MTTSDLSRPDALRQKASGLTAKGSPMQEPSIARERSLTEMMLLNDWGIFVPESVGLLVAISLVRTVLPGGPTGAGSMPHPFWIPVLLMSGQYGIMGGLFATLAATAVFFISGLPPQSATQDYYAYAGIVATQPCAWFGTALVLGGLRTLHIHHKADLQKGLDRTGLVAEHLADGLERAVSEIERLEHRIAADSSTLASFLDSLAKIDLSDRGSFVASIADVIRYGVGATSFSVHLRRADGRLLPCIGVEDGSRVTPAMIVPLMTAGLQEIRDDVAITGALPPADGDRLARMPLCAPIHSPGAAEPVGVVVCNRLLPSQDPAIAMCRLNEVCRVLAILLSACPEAASEACRDDGT